MREHISVRDSLGRVQTWEILALFESSTWNVKATDASGVIWEASGESLFDAFGILREAPEAQGYRFLVVGARVDCWPTRMSDAAGGVKLVTHPRSGAVMVIRNLAGYVFPKYIYKYIFSPASAMRVGTVAEQSSYRESWERRAISR
jgi:hypothetical protein